MNILALETSSSHGSLALEIEGGLICETSWVTERNHDASLFPGLKQALDALSPDAHLDLIIVGAGPGSYGGVRVALAAAEGVALVHEARVVALPSWCSLAPKTGECFFVSDARRNGWTFARFKNGALQGDWQVLSAEETRARLAAHPQIPCFSVEEKRVTEKSGLPVVQSGLIPSAKGLIEAWRDLPSSICEQLLAQPAVPIYVRPPHITQAKQRPWEVKCSPSS